MFPATPVLFVGTTDARPKYGTSVFSETDWNGTLKLAVALQPDTRHVYVVAGASEFDRATVSGARRQFAEFEKQLEFTYLVGLPMRDLERTLAALPAHSIIYYVNVSLDGAQRRFEGRSALDRIAASANAPIYIQSEANFGRHVMGGRTWSSRPWGFKSSEIVARLLGGEAPGAIPPSRVEIYSSQLDWRQMQRWKVDERRLPAGTQVLFRDPTIWEEYRIYILGATALMLVQFAFIGGLLVQRTRRRRVESSLRASERRARETADRNQDLAGRLISAQETERTRIARDLHDDLSQQLAAVGIMLGALKRRVLKSVRDPDIDEIVAALQDRTTQLTDTIRTISHELHPSVLDHAGLAATLQRHCADVQAHHPVKVVFSASNVDALKPDVALCLFRVAQEAMTNALRHARARTIRVQLMATNEIVELRIMDDGVGFVPASSSGLGLRSIDERVRFAGGHVTLSSSPGQGTNLLVRIPLAPHAEGAREVRPESVAAV
jgi:signal transduction histidine kinase